MKPCIKLLGFKPRKENLRFHETVKHSYFLQPNEDACIGSRRTFIALLRSMVAKDVIGYAVMLARVSARPQICVLLAQVSRSRLAFIAASADAVNRLQKEELDETTGHQTKAPGIHVCQLPFADDMREIGLTSTLSAVVMPGGFALRYSSRAMADSASSPARGRIGGRRGRTRAACYRHGQGDRSPSRQDYIQSRRLPESW